MPVQSCGSKKLSQSVRRDCGKTSQDFPRAVLGYLRYRVASIADELVRGHEVRMGTCLKGNPNKARGLCLPMCGVQTTPRRLFAAHLKSLEGIKGGRLALAGCSDAGCIAGAHSTCKYQRYSELLGRVSRFSFVRLGFSWGSQVAWVG